MYQVLARKWRPQIFEDLVGQQTVTQTLQNAISSGRIAHAFLFSGPRGVGKTTSARILAKALNCSSTAGPTITPCNVCDSCADISASRSMDVLEIDGASNRGIDEVRELRESAKYQPMRDRFRIYIIDEVHMLTTEAFNALLKILEEPPPHVFFIFATTEFHKVPATIISRCQPFDFKRIPDRALVQRLLHITKEEGIEISERSLLTISIASDGGLRDALGTLDQVIAFKGTQIQEADVESVLGLVNTDVMIELGEAIASGESAEVLQIVDRISQYGIDYKVFYNELLSFYRDLFLIRFSKGAEETANDQRLRKLALQYDEIHLLRICHQLVSVQSMIRLSGNLRFLFEITLTKLSHMKKLVPLEELAESLKKNSEIIAPSLQRPPQPALPSSNPVPPAKLSAVPPSAQTPSAPPPFLPGTSGQTSGVDETFPNDFFAIFISDLEAQNSRLAATLEHAKFQRTGNLVKFYLPDAFYRMVKWDEKNLNDLKSLLEKKLGGEIRVEVNKGEPPVEIQAAKVATPETLVEKDPVVQEFVKTFKGTISKIELKKERYQ